MEHDQPSAHTGDDLSNPIHDIRDLSLLSSDMAVALCHRWRDHHDISAAHRLAASHVRLVVKVAGDYCGYGLPFDDLAGEGHLGLMRAICRFDPDRGGPFAAYAIRWIRAAIEEYVLNNWSQVTTGTTASQKKLLVSLRRTRGLIQDSIDGPPEREQANGPATTTWPSAAPMRRRASGRVQRGMGLDDQRHHPSINACLA
jgi:RNA polymerase sigma-32 factor